jgi:hypothetical protein
MDPEFKATVPFDGHVIVISRYDRLPTAVCIQRVLQHGADLLRHRSPTDARRNGRSACE